MSLVFNLLVARMAAAEAAAADIESDEEEGPLLGQEGVFHAIEVCGITQVTHRNAITNEGFTEMGDFLVITPKEVKDLGKRLQDRRPTPINPGAVKLKKLEALVHWLHDRDANDLSLDARAWTPEVMREWLINSQIATAEKDLDQDKVSKPDKFSPSKWVDWEDFWMNHLASQPSHHAGVSLACVLRDESNPPDLTNLSGDDLLFWNLPLRGARFRQDERKVKALLKELIIGTEGASWWSEDKSGRAGWLDLKRHHDSGDAKTSRINAAKKKIKDCFHRSERFPVNWQHHTTTLNKAFETLRKEGEPKTEREKVQILVDHVDMVNAPECVREGARMIQWDPVLSVNFNSAVERMGQFVATQSGPSNPPSNRERRGGRTVGALGTGRGRGGRGGGRFGGRNRTGRGGGGNHDTWKFGVDVHDPTRQFTAEERQKLMNGGYWSNILRRREAIKAKKKREEEAGCDGSARRIAALENRLKAVEAANQPTGDPSGGGTANPPAPANGGSFGSGTYDRNRGRGQQQS